ncbi:electron transporter YccM [Providencia heimbachae]|uniref:4Fe-4S binding protein n=1 Tax=Providencia heimbachae TaxID=333962 RepID=UPI0010BEFFBE|nr:4Fe-4S binding protein [Providencia heimbachae]QCJ71288.1 electron transporter YccM [Providencia heimbachae]
MMNKPQIRYKRRPGTVGGKLPWNDRRNASSWRKVVQIILLAINVYIGITFYYWVRYYETGGETLYLPRPGGIEGWLPIAGLMNLKYTLETGSFPAIHAASMFLLVSFIIISLFLKKAFCSWMCPIGTISEFTGKIGQKIFGYQNQINLPKGLDIPLKGIKYLLLSFFLYIALSMPAQMIQYFMMSPYGIIIDVKMLDFFRYISGITLVSVGIIVVISLFVRNAWCRYLCPYGALLGLFSLFSPVKIRRNVESCIDCGKCAKNCPSRIPVDKLIKVRTLECTGCMTCVESCPVSSTLSFSLQVPTKKRQIALSGIVMSILTLAILFITIGFAVYAGVWDSPVPDHYWFDIIPNARMIGH